MFADVFLCVFVLFAMVVVLLLFLIPRCCLARRCVCVVQSFCLCVLIVFAVSVVLLLFPMCAACYCVEGVACVFCLWLHAAPLFMPVVVCCARCCC